MNTEITIEELRRILRVASDGATLDEALAELAEAKRQEALGLEHAERLAGYERYLARRREREHEAVQGAYDKIKQATIDAGPVSRERVHAVAAEAGDTERVRFEIREPRLEFQEWLDAGSPAVHQIGGIRDLQAKAR